MRSIVLSEGLAPPTTPIFPDPWEATVNLLQCFPPDWYLLICPPVKLKSTYTLFVLLPLVSLFLSLFWYIHAYTHNFRSTSISRLALHPLRCYVCSARLLIHAGWFWFPWQPVSPPFAWWVSFRFITVHGTRSAIGTGSYYSWQRFLKPAALAVTVFFNEEQQQPGRK